MGSCVFSESGSSRFVSEGPSKVLSAMRVKDWGYNTDLLEVRTIPAARQRNCSCKCSWDIRGKLLIPGA